MGGNIKPCLWVLSKLSTQMKCAVVAPTWGIGNWDTPGSADFVLDVSREAIATLPLDPENIFLMGYSNGAMGVTRAAMKQPNLFKGLIYLSASHRGRVGSRRTCFRFPRKPEIAKFSFCTAVKTSGFLEPSSRQPRPRSRRGASVRLKVYDDEDHYLLFSRQEAVLGDIRAFMTAD